MNPTSDPQTPFAAPGPTPGNAPADSSFPPAAPEPPPVHGAKADEPRISMVFLAIVTVVSLALDLGTKWWALRTLTKTVPPDQTEATPIEVTSWLTFLLARNRGGAWGLLQNANETLRRPFFLIISAAAIVFVVYLYRKVHPRQHALRWGLPLVLGGAIGNLVDRVRYGWVIDFIDYRAAWVRLLNEQIARISPSHAVTDHWPTFNVADISICIGVGLMAVDIFTSRRIARNSQADAAAVPVSHELVDTSGESAAGDADAEVKADGTSSPRGGHA